MKLRNILKLVCTLVILAPLSAGAAVVLNVVGGELQGASGVVVNGNVYDVEFVDGSCLDLFNGCDEASDFTFQTVEDADAAAQALLDTVFIDTSGVGLFDTDPELTLGCTATDLCFAETPYGVKLLSDGVTYQVFVSAARNATSESGDLVAHPIQSFNVDVSDPAAGSAARVNFAKWTLTALGSETGSSVPEPAPLGIMLLGLAALSMVRGRRQS